MNSQYYFYIVILLCFSAFFSGSEIAYTSVNRSRLRKLAEDGNRSAKLAVNITEKFDSALSTILIGNNLVNIASSSIATVLAVSLVGEQYGAALSTAAMTVIVLIFGEISPKVIAREHNERFCLLASLPLTLLMYILYPFVWSVVKIVGFIGRAWKGDISDEAGMTEEELVTTIETAEDEGVIDENRSELLQSALEFSDISVEEILVPRVDMIALSIDAEDEEIISTALGSNFSRIPVYKRTVDNVVGVLPINMLLKQLAIDGEINLKDILMDVCFVHKAMKIPAVLDELKRRKTHLAIVTDEYGGTMGLVTMEDILEELVGDIWDEYDEVKTDIVQTEENTYTVCGDMSIYDFFAYLNVSEHDFESEYTSMGGWAIEMLGDEPSEGSMFTYENLAITITKMRDMRVEELSVYVTPPKEEKF